MKKKFNKKNIITLILGIIVSIIIFLCLVGPLNYYWNVFEGLDENYNFLLCYFIVLIIYLLFNFIFIKLFKINVLLFNTINVIIISLLLFIDTVITQKIFSAYCSSSLNSLEYNTCVQNTDNIKAIAYIYFYIFITIGIFMVYLSFRCFINSRKAINIDYKEN